jgi:hypothetical protein
MAEIKFPAWVEDDTAVPAAVLVRAKQAAYALAACVKLRLLHNGAWKWVRGEALDANEEAVVSEQFGASYPGSPPTEAQLRQMIDTWWSPRNTAAHCQLAQFRQLVTPSHLSFVNLQALI